jgi:hypothetical protein
MPEDLRPVLAPLGGEVGHARGLTAGRVILDAYACAQVSGHPPALTRAATTGRHD